MAAFIYGDEKQIYRVNVEGTKNLISFSKNKRFIFLSTKNVLDKYRNAYSESKKECEKMVAKIKNHLILRVSAVFGEGDTKNFATLIRLCETVPFVLVPGDGKAKMQPVHVSDVAQLVLKGIQKEVKGTYIIAGKDRVTLNEIVHELSRLLNKKVYIVHLPLFLIYGVIRLNELIFRHPFVTWARVANITRTNVFDMRETIRVFGYEPKTFAEGLKWTIEKRHSS